MERLKFSPEIFLTFIIIIYMINIISIIKDTILNSSGINYSSGIIRAIYLSIRTEHFAQQMLCICSALALKIITVNI